MTITAAQLQLGLGILQDLTTALSDKLANIPADEAVAADALQIAIMIDPALAPAAALLPVAEFLVEWILANNTQGRPGSQTPMPNSGAKGNTGSGGGQIP